MISANVTFVFAMVTRDFLASRLVSFTEFECFLYIQTHTHTHKCGQHNLPPPQKKVGCVHLLRWHNCSSGYSDRSLSLQSGHDPLLFFTKSLIRFVSLSKAFCHLFVLPSASIYLFERSNFIHPGYAYWHHRHPKQGMPTV